MAPCFLKEEKTMFPLKRSGRGKGSTHHSHPKCEELSPPVENREGTSLGATIWLVGNEQWVLGEEREAFSSGSLSVSSIPGGKRTREESASSLERKRKASIDSFSR